MIILGTDINDDNDLGKGVGGRMIHDDQVDEILLDYLCNILKYLQSSV